MARHIFPIKVAGIATFIVAVTTNMRAGSASRSKCIERARATREVHILRFSRIIVRLRAVKSWDWDHGKGLRDPTYRFELYASGWRVMGRCQRSAGILRDVESVKYSQ